MKKLLLSLMVSMPALLACDSGKNQQEPTKSLLIYCGITMAHPIKDIAKKIEKEKHVRIVINQGGSEDLYRSLSGSRQGDLYLPGSASYRDKHLDEGLLGDFVHVGYNQAAFIVKKGNPKGVTNDLNQLLRDDLSIIIGNADTGSIGRETKRILDKAGIYQQALESAVFVTTDSRNLNRALREGEADLILNWRATAFFKENRDDMDVIDLPPEMAKPKKLLLNQLTFSEYQEIGKYFMDYAVSEKGQEIFRGYGFLDNKAR